MRRDLPTRAETLEELADKVALQIDRLAHVAFDSALDEMTRYHRFLITLNASRTPDGAPFSYAEIGGDAWAPPHVEWIREYARLFERAAERIAEEDHFVVKLAYVAHHLLPEPSDPAMSPAVLRGIVDLFPILVHRLENWVTKRTTVVSPAGEAAQPKLALAGSDEKAYSNALISVVGAWERLLQSAPTLFSWRDAAEKSEAERWAAFRSSWPFLLQHLQNTAYALAIAVWNEDEIGVRLYRDTLARWPETLSHRLDNRAEVRFRRLLYPNVLDSDWDSALARVAPLVPDYLPQPTPEHLFASVVGNVHDDALLLTVMLFLFWTINEKQASDIASRTAAALLRRERTDPGDERLSRRKRELGFRSLFLDLIRLELAGERYRGAGYGAELDGFVSKLDNMTERRVVPGRVFTPSTLHERGELLVAAVALLAASVPQEGDDGVEARVAELARKENILPAGDRSLRHILHELQRYTDFLKERGPQVERGFTFFRPSGDLESAIQSLNGILQSTISTIEAERLSRLKARPVDPGKLERFRAAIEVAVLKAPPLVPFFSEVPVERMEQDGGQLREVSISGILKAHLVEPPMEQPMHKFEESLADRLRELAGEYVWEGFTQLDHERVTVAGAVEEEVFWRELSALAERVGPEPVLVVSHQAEARAVRHLLYPRQGDEPMLKIERRQRDDRRGHYLATVEGVDVYWRDTRPGIASLFSACALRAIRFYPVSSVGHYVTLDFELEDDGVTGKFRVRFRQQAEWAELPSFQLYGPDPEEDQLH